MRRRAAITSLHQMKEINVVPMIDVMMFLLVVFIITMPLIENGIPVNLPKGKAHSVDPKKSRQITIKINGQLYLDRSPITKDELVKQIRFIASDSPDTSILVRGDEGIAYGKIMEVMRILNDAQITKLALATSPENTPSSSAPAHPATTRRQR
jgi:biopolymer transport protein TolR